MRRIVPFLFFLATLAPAIAYAAPSQCTAANEDTLRRNVVRLVNEIRIGQYRADMALMTKRAKELATTLGDCAGNATMLARLCDSECQVQRASVHLFRASALPLLSSKGSTSASTMTEESDLRKEAELGLRIVEQAIDHLPRQRGFATEGEGLNRYLKAYASLSALKARLLMVIGDIWYRRASTTQLDALKYLVGQTLGDVTTADGRPGDYLYNASAYYDKTFWAVLEAETSLPADMNGSRLFSDELTTLGDLSRQVSDRIQSVREGKLYIGIDPGDLGGGAHDGHTSLVSLGKQVAASRDALAAVEGSLGDTMKEWAAKVQQLQQIDDDREVLRSGRAIDLQVFKMQEIQERTASLKATVETKLRDIQNEQDVFELRHKIVAAQLELERQRKELQNQLRMVERQTEQDLLAVNKERIQNEIETVRFDIDMTIADFNFQMQLDALGRERHELELRQLDQVNEKNILVKRSLQLDQAMVLENKRIEYAAIVTDQIRQRQDWLIPDAMRSIAQQIAAIDADLVFYNARPGLITELCAAQQTLGRMQQADLKALAACLTDGACGSQPGLQNAYNDVLAQKKAQIESRKGETTASIALLRTRIAAVKVAVSRWTGLTTAQAVMEGLYTTAAVLAAIPDSQTGMIGVFPVKTFKFGEAAAKAAEIVAQLAQLVLRQQADNVMFDFQTQQEITSLEREIAHAEAELKDFDFESKLSELATTQALAELSARFLEVQQQDNVARNTLIVQAIQCRQDNQQADATIARLQAEKASLQAQINVQSDESRLLEFEVQQQDNIKAQSAVAIQRLNYEKQEIAAEDKKRDDTIAQIARMIGDIDAQESNVHAFKGRVNDLAREKAARVAALNEHIDKISFAITNASTDQKTFLRSAISDAENVAFGEIDALKAMVASHENSKVLLAELQGIENDARDALIAQRKDLYRLIENANVGTSDTVIWDFENIAAELTRGAPELLDFKRALLESVNFYYNRYRYRYNLLSDFIGKGGIPDDQPFIWNAAAATSKLAYCGEPGVNPVCHPKSIFASGTPIRATSSSFRIDRHSPLFTQLLSEGSARFEISNYAQTMQESQNLGGYALWDEREMSQSREMRLIGISLGFEGLNCIPTLTNVKHLGIGYQFSHLSKDSLDIVPSLVVKKPITDGRPQIFTAKNVGNVSLAIRNESQEFTSNSYSVMGLETKLHNGTDWSGSGNMLYPYAGYPLVGSYEITVDGEEASKCLSEAHEGMTLNVIFAKR